MGKSELITVFVFDDRDGGKVDALRKKLVDFNKAANEASNPQTTRRSNDGLMAAVQNDIRRMQSDRMKWERDVTRSLEKEEKTRADNSIRQQRRAYNEVLKVLKQKDSTGGVDKFFGNNFGSALLGGLTGGILGGGAIGILNATISGVTALASATSNLALESIKLGANYQQTQAALKIFTGSARLAKEELQAIEKTAQQTAGLRLEVAEQGYQRLRGLGFEANRARNLIKELAEEKILSGASEEAVERVIFNFTQIASGGQKISQEIRELLTAMPSLRRAFLDAFGTLDPKKIQTVLDSDPNVFFDKLIVAMQKTQGVQGGLNDAVGKFYDSLIKAGRSFSGPFLDDLTVGVISLTKALDNNRNIFAVWGEGISDVFRRTRLFGEYLENLPDKIPGLRKALEFGEQYQGIINSPFAADPKRTSELLGMNFDDPGRDAFSAGGSLEALRGAFDKENEDAISAANKAFEDLLKQQRIVEKYEKDAEQAFKEFRRNEKFMSIYDVNQQETALGSIKKFLPDDKFQEYSDYLTGLREKLSDLRDDLQKTLISNAPADNPFVKLLTDVEEVGRRAEKQFDRLGPAAARAIVETSNAMRLLNEGRFSSNLSALRLNQDARLLAAQPESFFADFQRRIERIERESSFISNRNTLDRQIRENEFALQFNPNNPRSLEEMQRRFIGDDSSIRNALNDIRGLRSISTDGTGAFGSSAIASEVLKVLPPLNELVGALNNPKLAGDARFLLEQRSDALRAQREGEQAKFRDYLENQKVLEFGKRGAYEALDLLKNSSGLNREFQLKQVLGITSELGNDLDPTLRRGRFEALKESAQFEANKEREAKEYNKRVEDYLKSINNALTQKGVVIEPDSRGSTTVQKTST